MNLKQNKDVAIASFRLIESDDPVLAGRIIASDFVNREAEDDPKQEDRNAKGADGFLATSSWLRAAFADLRFGDIEAIAEDDCVAVRATMTGRHTGEFQGMPATGRSFRQRQIHFFRLHLNKIVEHVAQRDDLGLLLQLGARLVRELGSKATRSTFRPS